MDGNGMEEEDIIGNRLLLKKYPNHTLNIGRAAKDKLTFLAYSTINPLQSWYGHR